MYPKIGQNIEIHLPVRKKSCKSIIADIREDELLIALPGRMSIISLLSDETGLEVTFVTNENKYLFSSTILGREGKQVPLFRIKKPAEKDIRKIQQRDDFRVNAALQVDINGTEQWTINFSAGGMLCSCSDDLLLEEGKDAEAVLHLPAGEGLEIEQVPLKLKARRILPAEDGKKLIGFQFVKMDPILQGRIMQFCFERQRQMRMALRK